MSLSPALECAKCHATLVDREAVCPHCGEATQPCPICGHANRPGARFCGACGTSLQPAPELDVLAGSTAELELEDFEPLPSAAPDSQWEAASPAASDVLSEPRTAAPQPGAGVVTISLGASKPAFVGLAVALGLAVLAQTALLRSHSAMPAVPEFILACLIGGATAVKLVPGSALQVGFFNRFAPARRWQAVLAAAVVANIASLVIFASNSNVNLAWLLFAFSVVAVGVGFWLLDGAPRARVDWQAEAPWLAIVGVFFVVGVVLRIFDLQSVPYGLWSDAAYSGLQVERIMNDPGFR
ncbi:MAG: zinc ribbon domain-containing protein, partial [Chloroflexi bacterium]|nr:zinc ribbon domain-containing protein [Chloroflexota bacterium]